MRKEEKITRLQITENKGGIKYLREEMLKGKRKAYLVVTMTIRHTATLVSLGEAVIFCYAS